MINTYFPILVLMIMAAAFLVVMLCLSSFLGPKNPSEKKSDPFECGTIATGDVSGRHSVKFYLMAMTFIVFDIEIVFLHPWAVSLQKLGWYGFWAMMPFLLILSVGLAYEWKKGVLENA